QPFTAAGVFQGNDDQRTVEIANGVSVASNTSGARAFTAAGGTDVFQVLAFLKNELAGNDPADVATTVKSLDDIHGQIVAARADTGLLLSRLDSTDAMHQQS